MLPPFAGKKNRFEKIGSSGLRFIDDKSVAKLPSGTTRRGEITMVDVYTVPK